MKKENIALVVFLAFILGAGVYFYSLPPKMPKNVAGTNPGVEQEVVTPTPHGVPPSIPQAKVSTEGWKTCRNEEYGYEFKYPAEWYLYNNKESFGTDSPGFYKLAIKCVGELVAVSNKTVKEFHDKNKPEESFSVRIDDYTQSKSAKTLHAGSTSLDEYLSRVPDIQKFLIKDGYVDGERAVWIQSTESLMEVLLFHKKKSFWFMMSNRHKDVHEAILSTFRFIN
jgi:hypothetical protein